MPAGHMQDTHSIGDQWESTEMSFLRNNGTEAVGEDIQQRHSPAWLKGSVTEAARSQTASLDHLTGHDSTALAFLCLSKPEEKAEKTI